MKILFLLHSLAHFGGVERVITDKMNYLAQQGHSVFLITYEQGNHSVVYTLNNSIKYVDLNCRYHTIYKYSLFIRLYKAFTMKKVFKHKLESEVRSFSPDLIVFPTNVSDFLSVIMSSFPKIPKIIESHGAFNNTIMKPSVKGKIRGVFMLRHIKKCSLLLSLTEGDASCWRRYVSNVKSLPNPVTFYFEKENNIPKMKGRIISVGRIDEGKRYDRLIKAFSIIAPKYKEWFIDIFGKEDDPQVRASLVSQIECLGLVDRIMFRAPTSKIIDEYLSSEMFVLSSDSEGMPLVLLEAMSCGLPVVSVNCPYGPSDLIEDGVTGLLTQMNEVDLAEKMDWMISHPDERRMMGEKAHIAAARYKPERVMKEWEEAYLSVINTTI